MLRGQALQSCRQVRRVGDQDGGGQSEDVAVARLSGSGSRAALAEKGFQYARAAGCDGFAENRAEQRGRALAARGAGEDYGNGHFPAQQEAQHLVLHMSVKTAHNWRAFG